jgi:ABC-type glycerol-3-phosphate transport system substrate-binding protein
VIDRYGLIMAMSFTDQDFGLMFGTETNNATFLDAEGMPILEAGTPNYDRFVEALAYLKELKTCCMADGVLTWTQSETRPIFLNDEAAMLVSSTSFVYNIQSDAPDMFERVSTFPWPYNSDNPEAKSQNYWAGYGHAVLTQAEHPDAARVFVEYMHREDVELKWFQDTITGWLPVRKSIAESDEYWGVERLQEVEPVIRVAGASAAANGVLLGMENGANPWAPIFFGQRLYSQLFTKLIAEDLSPEEAAQWMQTEMLNIIAANQ